MVILPQPVSFEWDEGNINKNQIEHGVTNFEAEEVFTGDLNFIFENERPGLSEKRYLLWGKTRIGRKLAIVFTIRGEKIRIISARDINKKERRAYEEKIQSYTRVQK